jgi:hypothetical protein
MDYKEIVKEQLNNVLDEEHLSEIDEISRSASELSRGLSDQFSFDKIIDATLSGQSIFENGNLISSIKELILFEVHSAMITGTEMLIICIIIGLLNSLAGSFGKKTMTDMSQLVCTMIIIGISIKSFGIAYELCIASVNTMVNTMEILTPVLIGVLISTGSITSGTILSPVILGAVTGTGIFLKKIILPSVHGFARIEGSKKQATEFIIGESRRLFQEELDKYLRNNCRKWGIIVNSVLIRDIIVPQEIAAIIRNRELAAQEARKYSQEIERARSEAELAKQKMLAEQNLKKVAANTEKLTAKIAAEQHQLEATVAAETELKVAEVGYKTAQAEAKAKLNEAEAERRVVAERNRADAEVLARQIEAFGTGRAFVQAELYKKIMPGIVSITWNGAGKNAFGLIENAPAKGGK